MGPPPASAPGPATASPPGGNFDDARWVREWERIDKLAQQWLGSRRDRQQLLRGDKLAHARRWLEQGRGRKPPPKREHKDFIRASARAAQLRIVRNVAIGGLSVGLVGAAAYKLIPREIEKAEQQSTPLPDAPPTTDDPVPRPVVVDTAASDAVATAAEALLEREPEVAALLALEAFDALPPNGIDDLRGTQAERVLRRATAAAHGRPLVGHTAAIAAVAMSPDGRRVASVDQGGESSAVSLWDLQRPGLARPQKLRGHLGAVRHLAFTPDGARLVTAGEDEEIKLWDLSESTPHDRSIPMPESGVTVMALSGDGRWLAAGGRSGRVRVVDLTAPTAGAGVLEGHTGSITSVFVSREGGRVATAADDGIAMVWRLGGGKPAGKPVRLEGHVGAVLDVALSPDGRWALTGGADHLGVLWDLTARVPSASMRPLMAHDEAVIAVGFLPDGRAAVTAGADDIVTVWKMTVPKPEQAGLSDKRGKGKGDITALELRGPTASDPSHAEVPQQLVLGAADGSVRTLDPSRIDKTIDGADFVAHAAGRVAIGVDATATWAASGGADGSLRVWDLAHRGAPEGLSLVGRAHRGQVIDMATGPAATRVVSGGVDGVAWLWDATGSTALRPIAPLPGHRGHVHVAVSPDGKFGATAAQDGVVHLWGIDIADADALTHAAYPGHGGAVNQLVFGPAGRVLISVAADKTARVWRMSDPSKDVLVLPHDDLVRLAAIGPDSRWLVTATVNQLNLWDLDLPDADTKTRALRGHDTDISAIAISGDGRWAASGDTNDRVVLWNLGASEPRPLRLKKHEDGIDALAFSPDHAWLASGSRDHRVVLWRLGSKHPEDDPIVLEGHDSGVHALAWSSDGRWLYSGDNSGKVRAWPVGAADPEAGAMVLAGHNNTIATMAVSQDGGSLLTAGWDGAVRLWPLQPEALHRVGCMLVGRNLTADEWDAHMKGSPRESCG
jgi:WD40 repeat protein